MKKNEMFMTYSTVCVLNPVQLFATLWTIARQAPLSLGFSRQEYWNGLPFPLPGGLPDAGIELTSCTAGRFSTAKPGNLCMYVCVCVCIHTFPIPPPALKRKYIFIFNVTSSRQSFVIVSSYSIIQKTLVNEGEEVSNS